MRDAVDVARNLEWVRERITAAGGDPDRLTLVAVTKGLGPEAVAAGQMAGLTDFGENYAQELAAKVAREATSETEPALPVRWHFLGRLQRNKVGSLAPLVSVWQSIDRPALVPLLAERAAEAEVLVQVNVTGEPQKGGCPPQDAADLVEELTGRGLDVRGLMAVGPAGDPELARPGFRLLVELADRFGLPERSMGMSDDFEVAVQEGATMLRLGRALFSGGGHPGA